MFKLDLPALREAAKHVRLMANPANSANRADEKPASDSQLAALAMLAISQHQEVDTEDAAEWQAERAAILEFDVGLSREDADRLAAEMHAAWLVQDRIYQQHHFSCPTCIAAGQGRGLRCGVGAALWTNYENTPKNPND